MSTPVAHQKAPKQCHSYLVFKKARFVSGQWKFIVTAKDVYTVIPWGKQITNLHNDMKWDEVIKSYMADEAVVYAFERTDPTQETEERQAVIDKLQVFHNEWIG
jgi:hypothetical protein